MYGYKAKEDRTETSNNPIFIDEHLASLSVHPLTVLPQNFVLEIFKIIRGYGRLCYLCYAGLK